MLLQHQRLIAVLALLFLLSCSETEVREPSADDKVSPDTAATTVKPAAVAGLADKAALFDKFLRAELPADIENDLLKKCETNEKENIFCYSMVHYDDLQEGLKKKREDKKAAKPAPIKIKFKNREVVNWDEVRAANTNALIRRLASLRPTELKAVEQRIIAEKTCPNNASIALAITLEDLLPDQITPKEIASFYQRGAECLTTPGPDRELVLTRSALFHFLGKDYTTASRLLSQAVNNTGTYLGRAYYWLFRTKKEMGDAEGAKQALEQLKQRYPFSFHTIVALTSQNLDPGAILSKSYIPNQNRSNQRPTVNILIEQVEALRELGYPEASAKVLDWAINESQEAEPELRLYLAGLKNGANDYRFKISVMTDVLYKNPGLVSKETMELYFPKVYFPVFEKNPAGIDPMFLLSVARQESAFNPKALSRAKAKGLLQILPITGRRFSRKRKTNLFDPEQNVQVGAQYVAELLKRTSGQMHFSLAAYNAGEGRVTTWSERYPTGEPILFIDLIPYRETREYVASVLRNYYWYRRIHDSKVPFQPKNLFDAEYTMRVDR